MLGELERLLHAQEKPRVRDILAALRDFCSKRDLPVPARATVYERMKHADPGSVPIESLPPVVRETLYNLAESGPVPLHQLAFHCLNYGRPEAVSYAAGLPWLGLDQAARLPGWRPRSRGVLTSILRARGIRR